MAFEKMKMAPWSDQKVSMLYRGMAWVFSACGFFVFFGIFYEIFTSKVPSNLLALAPVMLIYIGYFLWLFTYTAYKGHAPKGWFPWQ